MPAHKVANPVTLTVINGLNYGQRNYREKWGKRQVALKKHKAKMSGLEFNLTEADLIIPEVCPVLGIKLEIALAEANKDTSPSIDRLDPTRGYTKDNVAIISMKANRIKNDATLEELEKVYLWLKEKQNERP